MWGQNFLTAFGSNDSFYFVLNRFSFFLFSFSFLKNSETVLYVVLHKKNYIHFLVKMMPSQQYLNDGEQLSKVEAFRIFSLLIFITYTCIGL